MKFSLIKITAASFFLLIITIESRIILAGDSTTVPFSSQSSERFFTSFSFGMGVSYSDNSSLLNFIETDVDGYSQIPNDQKLSSFSSGILFFGSAERQVHKNFSVKGEYSYFIKSIDIPSNQNYQYSYYSHQMILNVNYLIPQKYSYFKFGLGGGYLLTDFTRKYITAETEYTSSGPAVKFEITFNAQLGKNAATYLSGFLLKSFMSDLKDKNGKYLSNNLTDRVNLSSFGAGIKLGLELYFF
ncbi:MAG: hypothetical protein JSS91_03070 [Bacteroidetes bacterium]|nr:hypothetical protein [Bacteroidota bacterium]